MKNKKIGKISLKNIFKQKRELSQEEKIYKSYKISEFFKLFFYVLGFPLLACITIVYSAKLYGTGSYNQTWSYAIKMFFLLWLIVGVVQLIFNHHKKRFIERSIFIVAFSLVIILFSILFLSLQSKNIVKKAHEEYDKYGVNIQPLERQYETFLPYTTGGGDVASFSSNMKNFNRVYGVGLQSKQIGSLNTDKTKFKYYSADKESIKNLIELANKENKAESAPGLNLSKTKINYFFDGDANYSVTAKDDKALKSGKYYLSSGLYADGMLFGIKQVYDILYVSQKAEESIKINGYKLSSGEISNNPDEVLLDQLKQVRKENGEYDKYKKTYLSNHSDDKGKYNLDTERLNKIIKSVTTTLNIQLTGSTSGLNVVEAILGLAKANDIGGIIDLINSITKKELTVNEALTFVAAIVPFVQSSARPDIMFLDNSKVLSGTDVTLREYALSRYYGSVHGSIVSTVVLPNENGRIGNINMEKQGVLASENALSAQQVKQLEADSSYMPKLHPILLLRRILLTGFPWLVVMMLISTYFGIKKEVRFRELIKVKSIKDSYSLLSDEDKEIFKNKINDKTLNNNENQLVLDNNVDILDDKNTITIEENTLEEKEDKTDTSEKINEKKGKITKVKAKKEKKEEISKDQNKNLNENENETEITLETNNDKQEG